MKMNEIREIAKRWDVDARIGRTKTDVVREIQLREGYSPCFRTREECDCECLWRSDCLTDSKMKGNAPGGE